MKAVNSVVSDPSAFSGKQEGGLALCGEWSVVSKQVDKWICG